MFARAEIAYRSGRSAEALPLIERLVADDSGNPNYVGLRGLVMAQAGNRTAAATASMHPHTAASRMSPEIPRASSGSSYAGRKPYGQSNQAGRGRVRPGDRLVGHRIAAARRAVAMHHQMRAGAAEAAVAVAVVTWLGLRRAPQPTAASPDQPNEELQPGAAPPTLRSVRRPRR